MTSSEEPSQSSRTGSVWHDPVLWFVLALVFVYAGVYNCLPISFPVFKQVFAANLEQMGRSQFLFFISGIVFSLIGGWIIGRTGLRRALAGALLAVAAALSIIGGAIGFPMVLLGAFGFGLAMAALAVVYSSVISAHFGDKRQSVFFLAGLADGSGAVVGAAALGGWFGYAERSGGSWRIGYYFAAAIVAALILWAWRLRSESVSRQGPDPTTSVPALSAMKAVLGNPAIYTAGLLGLFHGLSQGGMISFVGQLYQARFEIDAAEAAYFISLNSGGQFGGRFILSWITARWRIHELVVLTACAGGAALAFAATIISPNYLWGVAMFTLAGTCVSGNGPSLSSYVGMRFPSHLATAYALFGGFNAVGAAVGPYLIGVIGNRYGVEVSIWLGPLFSLSLSILAISWFVHERSRTTPGDDPTTSPGDPTA